MTKNPGGTKNTGNIPNNSGLKQLFSDIKKILRRLEAEEALVARSGDDQSGAISFQDIIGKIFSILRREE